MSNYVLFTDSACDIKPAMLDSWGVKYIPLTFRFNDDDREYSDNEMDITEFYDKMRKGSVAKTAAVNSESFKNAFENTLKEGTDILYLGFSSGLSTTYNSAKTAAAELALLYPERKIVTVDSLAASAGFGLFVYLVYKKKNEGASIEEAAEYAESIRLNVAHWFTVDDLVYLKRGGRISSTAAFVGNALGIKPVLHVDNDGKLINMFKVRGRKTSLGALVDKYSETALDPKSGTVFISNGDCMADAKEVARQIKEKHGVDVEIITDVGSVIGSHSGPGTLALFFVAKER